MALTAKSPGGRDCPRKSDSLVYTSGVDDSRTGRPGNVGVIGVAVYRERVSQPLAMVPYSPTRHTEFLRASDSPDEIITIYYDSRANLVARGIIPSPGYAEPRPFPANAGFVPDPRG